MSRSGAGRQGHPRVVHKSDQLPRLSRSLPQVIVTKQAKNRRGSPTDYRERPASGEVPQGKYSYDNLYEVSAAGGSPTG